MENILLFVVTVSIYYFIYSGLFRVDKNWICIRQASIRQAKRVLVIVLLTLPINIGGNVFTIAGNAVAEKSVYSLFSLYQNAGRDALTIIGLAYQEAGRDALRIIGLAYQEAGRDAGMGLGLAYQNAGHDAMTLFGLAYQEARHNALTGVGLAVHQRSNNKSEVYVAMALYQRVGEKTRSFAVFSALTKD